MAKGHRSKIKRERNAEKQENRFRAHHNFARISDTKARIVLEQIKGKDVETAKAILLYSPRYAADLVVKVLDSAVANAEFLSNERALEFDKSSLYVQEVFANQGPTMKRIQPRAQGRAYRINKRTSHITIILGQR
ncbi:MAG: 50S ribosomal protein L22 [Clostridiales bacterium]|jgi:large subunit ribosomal protein L22|nr:50S ribosomal protein L22 [Clostridiales bacterium]